MQKLNRLAALAAAGLGVAAVVGLLTAGPVTAQGNRPVTQVQVVNSSENPVPVDVNRLPAVQISSLPAVQVSSLPAVQVSSLPAVQVGNDSSNPVPVNVTNLPAVQAPDPVSFQGVVVVAAGELAGLSRVFDIPAGKRLVIETLNYETETPDHTNRHLIYVQTEHNGLIRTQRFMSDRSFDLPEDIGFSQIGEHHTQIFGDPSTAVVIRVLRSKATAASNIHLTLTGHLEAAS